MSIASLDLGEHALQVTWTDGSRTSFPYLFLLDNDPAGFHPQTRERQLDLLALPESPRARSVALDGAEVVLSWHDGRAAETRLPTGWLAAHRPGTRAHDPADLAPQLWDAAYSPAIPRFEADRLAAGGPVFLDWLTTTKTTGLSIVEGLADDEDAGVRLGERIGFLRRTNFGTTFRVETIPDPNNLAYTSHALPLHTDLPNQELPPGFQFLHCVRNDAAGGESTFADGFAIAEALRRRDPAAFDILARTPVPYRFHDRTCDIRVHRPLIGLDERGRVFDVRYSAHLLAPLDLPAESMTVYYGAYRAFMALTRSPTFPIALKLRRGEMVVFDNRRTLHGRTAFDPTTGHRLLKGFYVDRGEFDSRIRVLADGTR